MTESPITLHRAVILSRKWFRPCQSYARRRLRKLLSEGWTGTRAQMQQALHVSQAQASKLILELHGRHLGIVRYKRDTKFAKAVAVYGDTGGKPDAIKPAPLKKSVLVNEYKRRIVDRFGPKVGRMIKRCLESKSKASVIVVDGQVVYRRGVGVLVDRIDWREAA